MSCQPIEHKMAVFNYPYNRMNQYPLHKHQKQNKLNIIHQIASENDYKTIKPPEVQFTSGNATLNTGTHKKKLATFTYVGKETTYITKLLKNTNQYHTSNTTKNQLTYKQQQHTDVYNKSRICKLKCKTFDKINTGQTG
jgi:hypothetical protein